MFSIDIILLNLFSLLQGVDGKDGEPAPPGEKGDKVRIFIKPKVLYTAGLPL